MNQEMEFNIQSAFSKLPLAEKIAVYTRLAHGKAFRIRKKDIFGLNNKIMDKIYSNFLDNFRN